MAPVPGACVMGIIVPRHETKNGDDLDYIL